MSVVEGELVFDWEGPFVEDLEALSVLVGERVALSVRVEEEVREEDLV